MLHVLTNKYDYKHLLLIFLKGLYIMFKHTQLNKCTHCCYVNTQLLSLTSLQASYAGHDATVNSRLSILGADISRDDFKAQP